MFSVQKQNKQPQMHRPPDSESSRRTFQKLIAYYHVIVKYREFIVSLRMVEEIFHDHILTKRKSVCQAILGQL